MLPLLSFVPLLAAGQAFGSVTLTVNDLPSYSFGVEQCGSALGGKWLPALKGSPCSSLTLWVTPGECRDTYADGDLVLPEVTAASLLESIGSVSVVPARVVRIPVDDLPLFAGSEADGGEGCGVFGVEHAYKLCSAVSMSLDLACATQTLVKGTPATLRYDTQPPDPPELTEIEPLDSAIAVSFSVDGDTSAIIVQVRGPQDEGFFDMDTVSPSEKNATVQGLVNGFAYSVRVVAVDGVGNASAPSNELEATPRKSAGFWGACQEAGCQNGSCSAAGGTAALAALVLWVPVFGRRRRRGG